VTASITNSIPAPFETVNKKETPVTASITCMTASITNPVPATFEAVNKKELDSKHYIPISTTTHSGTKALCLQ